MNQPGRCRKCGAPLAANARTAFCPACLYAQAASDSSAAEADGEPASESLPAPGSTVPAAFPIQFGDYEILEKLGEGGMGVVYKARQRSLDRLVALKLLPLTGPQARPEFTKRFRAEAAAAASLQHPHIVAIHEVGVHEGQHFFAMDYVEGRSLAELVGNRPLPPKQAARYLQTISEAVHYAHERGILHRDLKPSNILIDEQGQPRVADFGLARRLDSDSELTLTGQVLGSPHYIPPEQAAGQHRSLSRRSDVYGLGAILYHLLTGRPPFVGEEMAETLHQVLNTDPIAPRLLNPLVPRDMETTCLKCLEKEPARRYATAQAVADELARFLRGEPIAARPVGFLGRLSRWCRRKPALAGAVGGLVLTIALGLAGILWAWRQANLHATAEERHRSQAEEALGQMELERAETFLEQGETASGIGWLAWVVRRDPTNPVASQRLVSALTVRNFLLPLAEVTGALYAVWSPDGERVATAGSNGMARVWAAADGRPLGPPLRHGARVNEVRFSPDGRRLATACDQGLVRLWDAESGQLLFPPLPHAVRVPVVDFNTNGTRFFAASEDGAGRVWDTATGQPVTPLLKHSTGVYSVRFSPDGRLLLTRTWDEVLWLWDVATGRRVETPGFGASGVRAAAFSPDGHCILASERTCVHFLDVATCRPLSHSLMHPDVVADASFSPDGQRVVTACWDGYVRLWEAVSGQHLEQLGRHQHWVRHAEFSPEGQRIVSAGDDCTVRFWQLGWRDALGELITQERRLRQAKYSPDGNRLLTLAADGVVRVWDARPGNAWPVLLDADRGCEGAQFSPQGRRVITAGQGGSARVWDAFTGQPLTPELRHEASVKWAEFSPNGRWVVTASGDRTARVWNAQSGESVSSTPEHRDAVKCARFSPDGQRMGTASLDGTARVWHVWTGKPVTPPMTHSMAVSWVAFSPDGQMIVTASWDGAARVWDAWSGQLLFEPLRHEQSVLFAEFTPDGRRIMTASEDGTGRFWDAATGKSLPPILRHPGWILSLRLNPAGTLVATPSTDTTARVWDLATGQILFATRRHSRTVEEAKFSPDGQWLATASADRTVRLWDVRTGLTVSETIKHPQRVHILAFSPDGGRLLVAATDYRARVWELPRPVGPAPAWLPSLAEAVVGYRLNTLRQLEPVRVAELLAIRRQVEQSEAADPYTRWARWFFADRSTRPQSPDAVLTVADRVRRLLDENTEGSLRQALCFSPTNREAFARLAARLHARNTTNNPALTAEAAWCERKAQEPPPR